MKRVRGIYLGVCKQAGEYVTYAGSGYADIRDAMSHFKLPQGRKRELLIEAGFKLSNPFVEETSVHDLVRLVQENVDRNHGQLDPVFELFKQNADFFEDYRKQ